MVKKVSYLILLISLIVFTTTVQADNISFRPKLPATSSVYKEGFYNFDLSQKSIITMRLITDTPTSIMILNENQNIEFITNMPFNESFNLYRITSDKIIGIVGDGEVAISFEATN